MKLICGEDRSAGIIHSSEPFVFDCSEKCDPLSELFSAAAPCKKKKRKKSLAVFQREARPIPHYPVTLLRAEGTLWYTFSERGATNSCLLINLNELLPSEVIAIVAD